MTPGHDPVEAGKREPAEWRAASGGEQGSAHRPHEVGGDLTKGAGELFSTSYRVETKGKHAKVKTGLHPCRFGLSPSSPLVRRRAALQSYVVNTHGNDKATPAGILAVRVVISGV
jgi:hypothetical protein